MLLPKAWLQDTNLSWQAWYIHSVLTTHIDSSPVERAFNQLPAIGMALEGLFQGPSGRVPESYSAIIWSRRQRLAVWREGGSTNATGMALEDLQTGIPALSNTSNILYVGQPFFPIVFLDLTPRRTECNRGAISLQRRLLYDRSITECEPFGIL